MRSGCLVLDTALRATLHLDDLGIIIPTPDSSFVMAYEGSLSDVDTHLGLIRSQIGLQIAWLL